MRGSNGVGSGPPIRWLMAVALAVGAGCAHPPTAPPTRAPAGRVPRPAAAIAPRAFDLGPLAGGAHAPMAMLAGALAAALPTGIASGCLALVRTDHQVVLVAARDGSPMANGPDIPWVGPGPPRASADGRFVVYLGQRGPGRQLVLWDVAHQRSVPTPNLDDRFVSEPDLDGRGNRLIFLAGPSYAPAIALYDRASGRTLPLPLPAAYLHDVRGPTLSGDGLRAAFVMGAPGGDANLVVLELSSMRPITPAALNSSADDRDPALSSDGRMLWFSSNRNGSYQLFAFDLAKQAYADTSAFASLADQSQPRTLGLDDGGLGYLSTVEGAPNLYMRPLDGWR